MKGGREGGRGGEEGRGGQGRGGFLRGREINVPVNWLHGEQWGVQTLMLCWGGEFGDQQVKTAARGDVNTSQRALGFIAMTPARHLWLKPGEAHRWTCEEQGAPGHSAPQKHDYSMWRKRLFETWRVFWFQLVQNLVSCCVHQSWSKQFVCLMRWTKDKQIYKIYESIRWTSAAKCN